MAAVTKPIGKVIDNVVDVVKDVGDFVQDDILIPVVEGGEDIFKAIEDDPVRSIVYIAAAVYGPAWLLPLVVAADTKESGGDIDDALEAGVKAYAMQYVGAEVGSYVGASAEAAALGNNFAPTASAIQTAETISRVAASAAVGATSAIILGEDPVQAALMGGAQAGVSAAMAQVRTNVAEYSASQNIDLSDELAVSGQTLSADYKMPIIPETVLKVVEAQLAYTLSGGDGTVSNAVIQQAIMRATLTTSTMQEVLNTAGFNPNDAQIAAITNGVIRTTLAATQGGDVSATAMKAIIDYSTKAVVKSFGDEAKTTIDKVTGSYQETEKKAEEYDFVKAEQEAAKADYNAAVTEGNEAKEKYDALRAEVEPRFDERARLKAEMESAKVDFESSVANINKGSTSESAELFNDIYNDAIKEYNAYTTELDKDYAENYEPNLTKYRNELDIAYKKAQDFEPNLEALTTRATELGNEYTALRDSLTQDADKLDEVLKPTYQATDKAFVQGMTGGTFNEEEYAKLNGLEDEGETGEVIDPYYHWLTTGKEEQLPINEEQYKSDFQTAASNLVNNALQAAGLTPAHLSKNTINLIKKQITEDYKGNLASINNADIDVFAKTISDQYILEQEFNDDILFSREQEGKISSEALSNTTKQTIEYNKNNVTDTQIANGSSVLKYNHNDGLINWEDIDGIEIPRYSSEYGGMVVTRKGSNGKTQIVDLQSGEVLDESLIIYIRPPSMAILEDGTKVPWGSLAHLKAQNPEKYLQQVSKLDVDAGKIVNQLSNAPVYDLAKNLFEFAAETETGQDILNSAVVKNTSGIVMQAGGELVQAANSMLVLANINPASTPAGKWARNTIKLGGDMKTEEWRATKEAMDKQRENATGFVDTTKAIFGSLVDSPVVFLSEFIGKEILQEVPIFIATGGAGNITRRLVMEGGEAYAKKLATKVKLNTALTLDAVESFGGTAGGAFDEAYAVAIKSGMTETEAGNFAKDVAIRAGTTALVTNFAINKVGGNTFETALYGNKKTNGNFLESFNAFSKSVTTESFQEGAEEVTAQGIVELSLFPLDPNRDVAGNLTSNLFLGMLAGGGTSTTLLAGKGVYNQTGDFVSNVLSNTNSEVNNIIKNYDGTPESLTAAETQLTDLGLTDNILQTNVLNVMSPSDYQSSSDVLDAFRNTDGVYTPEAGEENQFIGKTSDTDFKLAFDNYIDKGTVNRQEILDAAASENVTLTEDQITGLIGQKNEIEAITNAKIEFDPLGTTTTESTDFFKAIGYNPSESEVSQFTGSVSEIEQQEAISKFADPRMTDRSEVEEYFSTIGYTPTETDITQFIGQIEETKQKTAIGEFADPRMVDETEAFEAFKEAGLEGARPDDIQGLTGQYDQNLLADKLQAALPGARYNVLDYNLGEQTKKVDALSELLGTKDTKLDALSSLLTDQTTKTDALNSLIGTTATDTDQATGLYGTIADQQTNFNTQINQQNTNFNALINQQAADATAKIAADDEAAKVAATAKAKQNQQMQNAQNLYTMSQPATVTAAAGPEVADVGSAYDFKSIFRDAGQEAFYGTPYRNGGQVVNINDRLLRLIGGN